MSTLGWAYILGLVFQVRIGDQNVVFPLFATGVIVRLSRLQSHRPLSETSGFTVAWVSAFTVAGAGFLGWLPAVDGGAMVVVTALGFSVGSAGYAGAWLEWASRRGWREPAASARSAMRWMGASAATGGIAVATLLVFVSPRPAHPDSSFSPSSMFGRPVEGAGAGVALAAYAVVTTVALFELRRAARLIRHGLRTYPDVEL